MPNAIDTASEIITAAELATEYRTTKPTVLSWYHRGIIPAAVADGRVIRFSRAAVAEALAARANNPKNGRSCASI